MKSLFGSTDKGLVRDNNQDRFELVRISNTLSFAVLCDGMGGENGGSIAAKIATEAVCSSLKSGLAEDMTEVSLRNLLLSAVQTANTLVYETATGNPDLSGMGTTLIAAVFLSDTLYIAYVGDSRVYCVTAEKEEQITHDHTVVQMLVDIGEITPEDARVHPKRHFITRAVGVSPLLDVDFLMHPLEQDDIILLCSDGLYNYLTPGMLYAMLTESIKLNSAGPLIDFALTSGGSDNITAIVAKK